MARDLDSIFAVFRIAQFFEAGPRHSAGVRAVSGAEEFS